MDQQPLYQKVIQDITSKSKVSDQLQPFTEAFLKAYAGKLPEDYAVVFCLQTFEEIFMAAGLSVFRFCSGDREMGNLSARKLPVLCCPVVRSSLGFVEDKKEIFNNAKIIIVPTTCDWKVKMCDYLSAFSNFHMVELPHSLDKEKNQLRWLAEVKGLVKVLENAAGKRITASSMRKAIEDMHYAQTIASSLENLRIKGVISNLDFLIISGAYFVMDVAMWSKMANHLLSSVDSTLTDPVHKVRIFLAGAPCIFPNFKLPFVVEEFQGTIVGDELCSSSRQFWDITVVNELNKENLLMSIANRYHLSCICPSFSPNRDRLNRIFQKVKDTNTQGVIYHVLKGCHLYDFERFKAEEFFRKNKIPFLHIETDDGWEDMGSLRTRVEAFVESIRARS